MPYISTCQEIFVANDGVHVVAADGTLSNCSDGHAFLEFFSSGNKIAEHDDFNILPFYWMRILASRWLKIYGPGEQSFTMDDAAGTFSIETGQRDVIVFDLATGRVVRSRSPWAIYLLAPVVAVPLVVIASRRWLRGAASGANSRQRSWSFTILDLMLLTAITAAAIAVFRNGARSRASA